MAISSRSRGSTVTYTESDAAGIRKHIEDVISSFAGDDISTIHQKSRKALEALTRSFVDSRNPHQIKDAFRHQNGLPVLLDLLRTTFQSSKNPHDSEEAMQMVLSCCQRLLSVLTIALQDHWGNRKYFRSRIEGGGWKTLGAVLKDGILKVAEIDVNTNLLMERIFGFLLAFAFEDESFAQTFPQIVQECRQVETKGPDDYSKASGPLRPDDRLQRNTPTVQALVDRIMPPHAYLYNPEIISIIFEIWLACRRSSPTSNSTLDNYLLILPSIVNALTEASTHNLIALHYAGLLRIALPAFLDSSLKTENASILQAMTVELLSLGVTDLDDAHFLYKNACSSKQVAELLRLALKKSCTPPFIHFDLSLHGFSSIEIPNIANKFPPLSSSAGYTLSLWLQIVQFDSASHTTIFGAFDSSQTCFVLVYLEKDTRNLILQTSVTASRPSVRFKSYSFEPLRWYHLGLTHRRAKMTTSSRASLFVDGEFIEQVKAHYPLAPPHVNPKPENSDSLSSSRGLQSVQVFLGTPQDLAPKLGRGMIGSQWRLASAYLFSDVLSDDLIAVHKELGSRYYGNYQDCLGSFQTYQASAALNLRNENLHPGKEEKSDIVAAIRSKAGNLLPEAKVLLNISPMMAMNGRDRDNSNDEEPLVQLLTKPASRNLRAVTRGSRTTIIINGAVSSINEALLHSYGFAVLTGDPAIIIPRALDDASWRIGGCAPVGLQLIDAARDREDIGRALDILFGMVEYSWRNSEAMERENGFGVLSTMLTAKLGGIETARNVQVNTLIDKDMEDLAYEVLSRILDFLGYRQSNPTDSVMNNPLAYRILLVDLPIWRTSSLAVQKLYYEQFSDFSTGSKHRQFNGKRLARMR